MALLAAVHRDEPGVLPDALYRSPGDAASGLHVPTRAGRGGSEPLVHDRSVPDRALDLGVSGEPAADPDARPAGGERPLGRRHARVEHRFAAARIQLLRDPYGREPAAALEDGAPRADARSPHHAPGADPRALGLDSRKMAFWAFIGSECLLFTSLISTYLVYKGRSVVGPYPHEILNIPFTSVSTFDLLMSSLMMVLALAAVQRGDMRWGKIWLFSTALLGLVFLGGQVIEFTEFVHKGLTLQTNLFGCTFFVLTGTHGAHVSVGVLWLLTLWVRAL